MEFWGHRGLQERSWVVQDSQFREYAGNCRGLVVTERCEGSAMVIVSRAIAKDVKGLRYHRSTGTKEIPGCQISSNTFRCSRIL